MSHAELDVQGGERSGTPNLDPPDRARTPNASPLHRSFFLAGAAGFVALVGVALAWSALPDTWRVSIALGVLLLALTAFVGLPLLIRARSDLQAARQLLLSASERMREAYERLLTVNDQLRQTADARDQAMAELQATVRQRESFLEAVAHDLKTPLTVIKGHAYIVSHSVERGNIPDQAVLARSMERIGENAERMRALIEELLALARLDNEIVAHREPIDLVAFARTAVSNAALTTRTHEVVLETDCSALVGEWDRQRLDRIFANLLANAINYSPGGGVISVGVSSEDAGATAKLVVQDQGIGIPERDLDRVFERFHRGDNVPETIAGTGLGLASVRQGVELHGGRVSVTSTLGEGSRFTVWLPVDPPPSKATPATTVSAPITHGPDVLADLEQQVGIAQNSPRPLSRPRVRGQRGYPAGG